jgi:hypothetical protein
LPISADLEAHGDQLEARDGLAVPGAVVGDIHGGGVGIELAVDGRRVGEESQFGCDSALAAGLVAECTVGCLDEEVADLEGLVAEVGGLPDGKAGRVAVPVVVGDGDVAHVVDLLAWVILVDIGGLAVDGAFEVVAAVLYAPEPMSMVSS